MKTAVARCLVALTLLVGMLVSADALFDGTIGNPIPGIQMCDSKMAPAFQAFSDGWNTWGNPRAKGNSTRDVWGDLVSDKFHDLWFSQAIPDKDAFMAMFDTFHPDIVKNACHYTVHSCYNTAREAVARVTVYIENVRGDTVFLSLWSFLAWDEDYKLLKYRSYCEDAEWATLMASFIPTGGREIGKESGKEETITSSCAIDTNPRDRIRRSH
jgi:hypothetical protein